MHYHIWTIGCQMNKADSERVAAALEAIGLRPSSQPEAAQVVVVNTCVVRGSAEEKVAGKLGALHGLKRVHPEVIVAVMGCLVPPDRASLAARFPQVDLFFTVHETQHLVEFVRGKLAPGEALVARLSPVVAAGRLDSPGAGSSEDQAVKRSGETSSPARYVPIIYGCDNFCAYCIVPYRRGPQRSRPPADVVRQVEHLVSRGAREVTLLGQNVDAYRWVGQDVTCTGETLPSAEAGSASVSAGSGSLGAEATGVTDLAGLLEQVSAVPGLLRLRFLTSHPRDMSERLIRTVAALPKVCPAINLPVQSGDDRILAAMRRGYTVDQYRSVVGQVRAIVAGVALTTDVIVGFPGETQEEFGHTLDLLGDLRFDLVHVAAYSPRPGTEAAQWPDDVAPDEKLRRLKAVETLQASVAAEINAALLGKTVEVLVEGRHKGKWTGRTPTDKLVFFQDGADWLGLLSKVRVTRSSPWSLQGEVTGTL